MVMVVIVSAHFIVEFDLQKSWHINLRYQRPCVSFLMARKGWSKQKYEIAMLCIIAVCGNLATEAVIAFDITSIVSKLLMNSKLSSSKYCANQKQFICVAIRKSFLMSLLQKLLTLFETLFWAMQIKIFKMFDNINEPAINQKRI